jgi:hypothetical protein
MARVVVHVNMAAAFVPHPTFRRCWKIELEALPSRELVDIKVNLCLYFSPSTNLQISEYNSRSMTQFTSSENLISYLREGRLLALTAPLLINRDVLVGYAVSPEEGDCANTPINEFIALCPNLYRHDMVTVAFHGLKRHCRISDCLFMPLQRFPWSYTTRLCSGKKADKIVFDQHRVVSYT